MRYIMIGKLFMQPVIYVEEKIVRSTVNKQLEVSGLYQMDQPHHRMFIPGVGMVMITSDALLYVPVIRKRTDIHTSGGTPGEGKKILMAKSQIQRPMPRSEERRVGKDYRARRSTVHGRRKMWTESIVV